MTCLLLFLWNSGIQYSFALQLTKKECEQGKMNFDNNIFENVRKMMAKRKLFNTKVIAAIPNLVINTSSYTEHAEYRVLKHLSKTVNRKKCVIVYSHFSPCTGKCLNKTSSFNIYPLLENVFKNIEDGYKAFVFGSVFPKDLKNQPKQEVFNLLNETQKNVKMYCCFYDYQGMKCSGFSKKNCLSEFNDKYNRNQPKYWN